MDDPDARESFSNHPPENPPVRAREGQLDQMLSVNPPASGRRHSRAVISHDAIGLQGDAVASDRVLDGAKRFQPLRADLKNAVSGPSQIRIGGGKLQVRELP